MLIALGQDDSIFAATSIICAVLLFFFILTAKNLDAELRKPVVALMVSILAGVVIYASKAIPMAVMDIFCFGLLVGVVRNIMKSHGSNKIAPLPLQTLNAQQTSDMQVDKARPLSKATSLIGTDSFKLLWPAFSIVIVLVFFGFIYLLFNKAQFASLMSSIHPLPSSASATPQPTTPIIPASINALSTKVDAQRETALSFYQQAKINNETSVNSVDSEWNYLSKNVIKHDLNTWLNSQQAWKISKKHVCGQVDEALDVTILAATELDSKTKVLRCDTDANLNRASYIKSSADAMIKGHKPNDDIGNLIQNLSNK
jgi:hypothetical protein